MVYDPEEDSFLVKKNISNCISNPNSIVLDMGTGSGIQALEASKYAKTVYAVDIDKEAIDYCLKEHSNVKNIKFLQSNLFSVFKSKNFKNKNIKFNLIVFNPPYLPQDEGIVDIALYGGKKGYEIYESFFDNVVDYLSDDGKILILFSELTNKEKVESIIKNKCLDFKELDKKSIFFEYLFVYEIKRSDLLKTIESKSITNVSYLAKGKRGIVFTGNYKKKKVAIKTKNPESFANNKVFHEAVMLKKLNKYKIGPKYLFYETNFLVYEFANGVFLPEFIEKEKKQSIVLVLKEIFNQLKILDNLKINKDEMSRPIKHVIVDKITSKKINVTMIDFERAKFSQKSHNITQFSKYLISELVYSLLKEKGFDYNKAKVIELCILYSKNKIEADILIDYILSGKLKKFNLI